MHQLTYTTSSGYNWNKALPIGNGRLGAMIYGNNTSEHFQINEDSDITFEETFILDKEVDNIDTVLKRLTYMSDMKATAYGIYIDNALYVIVESEAAAKQVLEGIKEEFMQRESDKLK